MVDRRFRIQGPAVVNVSGGRTSGFMFHEILDAYDGKLPPDVVAVFCNTGREMEPTLDFVREMTQRWGVHIQWLEYRRDAETGKVWAEPVSHNSASRQGEPYEALLAAKKYLPNPVTSFCTIELKIRTTYRWLRSEYGWARWLNVVGFRADEMHRVVRAGIRNSKKKERFRTTCPLAKARATKADVMAFWALQPFDLELAGAWEGNCDGCFKKNRAAIERMFRDHPDRMDWWPSMEGIGGKRLGVAQGKFGPETTLFRADRESYAAIRKHVQRSPLLPGINDSPETWDVFADCEGGCGV